MRDFKGMKRQRGRNRNKGGGANANNTNPNRSWDSQGPENIKVRGNAQTVYERYMQLARDASSGGDRVLAENYMQHAEHYFRVLRALQPARPVSEIAQREQAGQGFDIDFEDESGAQAAAILAAQQAEAERLAREEQRRLEREQNGGADRGYERPERNNERNADRSEADADSNGGGNGDSSRRETRRERWERRRDERNSNRRNDGDRDDHATEPDADPQPALVNADESPEEGTPRPARSSRSPRGRRPERDTTERDTTGRGEESSTKTDMSADAASLPGFLTRPTATLDEEAPAKPTRRRSPRAKAEAEDGGDA